METIKKTQDTEDILGESRSRIYCRLINPEQLGERSRFMPHEKFLDLYVVYYLKLDVSQEESLTMQITDYHLHKWGIMPEELKKLAWENTLRDYGAVLHTMDEVLLQCGCILEPRCDNLMYVLSNENRQFGAVCMVYPGELDKIGEILGGDYYLIPSSVHECILVRCAEKLEPAYIRQTIRQVNDTVVEEKEILANTLYRYRQSDHTLVIDNS